MLKCAFTLRQLPSVVGPQVAEFWRGLSEPLCALIASRACQKPRIYVETTVPSAYYADRTDLDSLKRRATTRTWWDGAILSSELVTSDVVLQELASGRPEQSRLRLAMAKSLHVIDSGTAELTTALTYVRLKVMPGNPLADALHLAIASHHRCDVLLTWNYHHLANPNKLDRIRKLNEALGLSVPRILAPEQLMEDDHE